MFLSSHRHSLMFCSVVIFVSIFLSNNNKEVRLCFPATAMARESSKGFSATATALPTDFIKHTGGTPLNHITLFTLHLIEQLF